METDDRLNMYFSSFAGSYGVMFKILLEPVWRTGLFNKLPNDVVKIVEEKYVKHLVSLKVH